eukprot:gene3874-4835_t
MLVVARVSPWQANKFILWELPVELGGRVLGLLPFKSVAQLRTLSKKAPSWVTDCLRCTSCISINSPLLADSQVLSLPSGGLQNLTRLEFHRCTQLTDDALIGVFEKCSQLTHFLLKGSSRVTDVSICEIPQRFLRLQYLALCNLSAVTDASTIPIFRTCPLQHVDVYGTTGVTDASIELLGPALQFLSVSKNPNISDKSMSKCVRTSPHLQELYCYGCPISDSALQLLERCHNLRALSVSECEEVSDATIQAIGKGCRNLRYLSVNECHKVTDISINVLGSHCTKLRVLDVGACEGVTDQSIRTIGERCSHLEKLYVWGCFQVTDASISVVAANCCRLRRLVVSGCKDVTDVSISQVARFCPNLQLLNVGECKHITDISISLVGQRCSKIEQLSAYGCPGVTVSSLQKVVQGCALREDLYGCHPLWLFYEAKYEVESESDSDI